MCSLSPAKSYLCLVIICLDKFNLLEFSLLDLAGQVKLQRLFMEKQPQLVTRIQKIT